MASRVCIYMSYQFSIQNALMYCIAKNECKWPLKRNHFERIPNESIEKWQRYGSRALTERVLCMCCVYPTVMIVRNNHIDFDNWTIWENQRFASLYPIATTYVFKMDVFRKANQMSIDQRVILLVHEKLARIRYTYKSSNAILHFNN